MRWVVVAGFRCAKVANAPASEAGNNQDLLGARTIPKLRHVSRGEMSLNPTKIESDPTLIEVYPA
jgi:hypothetical protein